ncbi:MAG: hypothetical protein K9K66_02280 [Desulfarculaceae bacterium]|nr:hypothetical protein [Desulfarculaceae bacterium]MCF8070875.1 hypothetical protein [Desulfarculaceae bacterium]MCF8100463.1 hypothetical protein [Desulfarculaceae bacterium]MCF8117951.1 hypothetical protein [Desulfarculaceae bacterium]
MQANIPSNAPLLILALAWLLWCGVHSLLLADFLRPRLQQALRLSTAQYRLAYSGFSLLTIFPLMMYSRALGAFIPLFWAWPWLLLQMAAWAAALGLLLWSSHDFSSGGFDLLGLGAAFHHRDGQHHLVTSGAYAHMRHPMHLAALLVVWLRPLTGPADWLVSLMLTVYIALGTWHEESRLRKQFGGQYRAYAARVHLIPTFK